MRVPVLVFVVAAACSGAHMQTLQLVNRSPRAIEEVYVYKAGALDHGKSRAQLAPGASTSLQVEQGNVEVMAVSAKMQLDEHTRDRPSASQSLELKAPAEIVFYDVGGTPPELAQKGVFGVAFQMPRSHKPAAAPDSGQAEGEHAPAE